MEASKQKPRRRLWQAIQPIGDIHWGGGGELWEKRGAECAHCIHSPRSVFMALFLIVFLFSTA